MNVYGRKERTLILSPPVAWYGQIPGLKVVSPYSAEDCRGLLKVRSPAQAPWARA